LDYPSEISLESGKFSEHYENFPVASFLLPSSQKLKIKLIYWFARTADDLADEGNISVQNRNDLLNKFEGEFLKSLNHSSEISYMNQLAEIIISDKLSSELFLKLLSAFKQDVTKNRYFNFEEILNYCNRSANPVGRLVLEIFNYRSEEMMNYSDKICTSLQLINFIQDTQIDLKKNRLYYPLSELQDFQITEQDFLKLNFNPSMREYIKFNVNRAQDLMNQGKPLLNFLKGRLAIEIKWTILGGEEILKKIKKADFNVMAIRPTVSKFDYSKIFIRSLLKV
jgi:squalene synthase HpnC